MKDTLWKMGRKLFFLSSFCASFTPASCRSHQNQVVTLYTPHPCPAPSPPPTSHVLVPCSLITQSVWRKGLKKVWKKQLWSMHLKLASMAALTPHGSPAPEPESWYTIQQTQTRIMVHCTNCNTRHTTESVPWHTISSVPHGSPAPKPVSWYTTPTVSHCTELEPTVPHSTPAPV